MTGTGSLATRLRALEARTGRSEQEIIDDAVCRLYENLIGDDSEPGDGGTLFKKRYGEVAANPVLRQTDDMDFVLEEAFRYEGPDYRALDPHGSGLTVVVPRREVTDLASVPSVLTWFVPRYGRHTLPALLHDHLQPDSHTETRSPCAGVEETPPKPDVTSEQADTFFRQGMRDTGVPLVRRWLMWSAVSVRSVLSPSADGPSNPGKSALLLAWRGLVVVSIAFLVLDGLLGVPWLVAQLVTPYHWLTTHPWLDTLLGWIVTFGDLVASPLTKPPVPLAVLLVLFGPVVAGIVFGRRFRVGVIVGYGLLIVTVPLVFVALGTAVYGLAELVAKVAPGDSNPVRTRAFQRARQADA